MTAQQQQPHFVYSFGVSPPMIKCHSDSEKIWNKIYFQKLMIFAIIEIYFAFHCFFHGLQIISFLSKNLLCVIEIFWKNCCK